MAEQPSIAELWNPVVPGEHTFQPERISSFPEAAQLYLKHAIAPGRRLASAVRLRMHGEIKLKGWLPFTAEQVINRSRGMIWRATVRIWGLPIRGFDRFVDGQGAMRWKLLGMIPVMTESGEDISRSSAGRLRAEMVWLPSVFCGEAVSWKGWDHRGVQANFTLLGDRDELNLAVNAQGGLKTVNMQRWGNPDGAGFHYADFGGIVEDDHTFEDYTIPSRLRIGWFFGTPRFETEGEFFRVTVDDAAFR